jgi:hypothetical protein
MQFVLCTQHLINHHHLQRLRRPDICTGSGNCLIAAGEDGCDLALFRALYFNINASLNNPFKSNYLYQHILNLTYGDYPSTSDF